MKKLLNLLFIMVMASSFIACSDLKKEEVKKAELSDSRFQFNCKLEIAALKNILTERVEDQISCLENYLVLVANILASDKPRAIGRVEFEKLLSRGVDGLLDKVDGDIVRALGAVFELNFLIGSGDKDFITEAQLKNLMKILRRFNKEVIPVYHEFANRRDVEYSWHKERRTEIFQSTKRLIEPILASFNKKRAQIDESNLLQILDVFAKGNEDSIVNKIKDFLIVKKIILGGHKDVITHQELYNLFKKAPAIVSVVYDAIQLSDINFKNALEKFGFVNIALTNIGRDIIVKRRSGYGTIFTIRELEYYFKKLYNNTMRIDFFKAKEVVQLVKDIFFGEGTAFTGPQLRKFTAFLRRMGHKMEYFLALYEANQDELDKVSEPFVPKLRNLKPKNQTEIDFKNDFKQMVNRYIYYKGEEVSASFTKKTKRNAKAMLEYVVFETLSREIFTYWEKKYPCDSDAFTEDDRCEKENYKSDLTMAQFRKFALVLDDFLVGARFITAGTIESTANTIVLLSDLLLRTSDSNVQISPYETAEFATVALSASSLGRIIYERLKLVCSSNHRTEIEPECFRENFVKELFRKGDDVDISAYAPNYYKYVKSARPKNLCMMVDSALRYTLTELDYKNREYISAGDITIMLIGMLHVESLMVLYDQNKNNQLDTPEIKKMYDERFFSLIDRQVGTSPLIRFIIGDKNRYKIFLHIIKEKEAPGTGKVIGLKFKRLSRLYTNAERDRLNAILSVLGGSGGDEDDVDYGACSGLR